MTSQCNRWSVKETELLAQVREALATEIAQAGQFPEVIGDRGIIRFIRGHGELEKIITMYGNFLKWRKESGADAVRERIRVEHLNKPSMFPNGEGFLGMSAQIIVAADAVDNEGNLIAFETFDFSPSAMMKKYTLDDWGEWMIYTMIYKTLVIEQVSEERERALLREHNGCPPCTPEHGYGVLVQCTSIRCLRGMGMEFLGSDSKAIIRSSIAICQDNFPEMLYKSHMVRTPWVFNTMWYFCKGLMDARTLAKVNVMGSTFLEELQKEIPLESIPKHFGGKYEGYNDEFKFDWSENGPMDLSPELKQQQQQEVEVEVEVDGEKEGEAVLPPAPPAQETSS